MLPIEWLLRRLRNEEEELEKNFPEIGISVKDLYDVKSGRGTHQKIPTPVGIDSVEVVRIYEITGLKASGYAKFKEVIKPQDTHDFNIYILRSYPWGLFTMKDGKTPLYEAPIRIRHMSNIFHPNIMPGPKYIDDEYAGAVCWAVYSNWVTTFTLSKLVEGYKFLIENPNPDPREALKRPICQEAAVYFSQKQGLYGRPLTHAQRETRRPIVVGVS